MGIEQTHGPGISLAARNAETKAKAHWVMQIEVANECSLSCAYCPHPTQKRPKGNMTFETFRKCIALVQRSANPEQEGRKFVWLNHFGEPLLNPLLPDFIAFADENGVEVSFASNCVDNDRKLFPRSLWQTLADAGLKRVTVSAHAKSELAIRWHIGDIVKIQGVWKPKRQNWHDWAGQVDMKRFRLSEPDLPKGPCDYETHNMFAITWDGRIAACCYDIEGRTGISIDDVLEKGFAFREISICANCRLGRGDASWLSVSA